MKIFKILAMFLVTAILCLTIGNAVTGHGIKGNSNLNVTVLANETGTGTGTTGIKIFTIKEMNKEPIADKLKVPIVDDDGFTILCDFTNGYKCDLICILGVKLETCFDVYGFKSWTVNCVP